MTSFHYGQAEAELDVPEDFPTDIDTAEGWVPFKSFKRVISSRFTISDFGCERLPNGTYIVFPLEKEAKKEKPNELKELLETFTVFGEKSPKSTELLQLITNQKKRFAESQEFSKAQRLGLLKFVGQLVVLRREMGKATQLAPVLNTKCIPISAMGDLESSQMQVSTREALDFMTQQALKLLGAQRLYDDLLAHWNEEVPSKEKITRDSTGAAPFWAAQKKRFVEVTHQLRVWPDFGPAELAVAPAKDSLLWLGKEALTDSSVKFQERQAAIRTAYHQEFKAQTKHASLCNDIVSATSKKQRVEYVAVPQAPRPSAPQAVSTPQQAETLPTTLSMPRSAFFSVGSTNPRRSKNWNRRPQQQQKQFARLRPTCARCKKEGHIAKDCRSQ